MTSSCLGTNYVALARDPLTTGASYDFISINTPRTVHEEACWWCAEAMAKPPSSPKATTWSGRRSPGLTTRDAVLLGQHPRRGRAASGDIDGDGDEDGIVFHDWNQGQNQIYRLFLPRDREEHAPRAAPVGWTRRGHAALRSRRRWRPRRRRVPGSREPRGLSPPTTALSLFQFSENVGGTLFTTATWMRGQGAQRLAGVSDLDGDGDLDFLAGRCVYFGRSTSVFERPALPGALALAGDNQHARTPFGDFDGDGDAGRAHQDPRVSFLSDGTGSFSCVAPLPPSSPRPRGATTSMFGYSVDDFERRRDPRVHRCRFATGLVRKRDAQPRRRLLPMVIDDPRDLSASSRALNDARAVDLDGDGDLDTMGFPAPWAAPTRSSPRSTTEWATTRLRTHLIQATGRGFVAHLRRGRRRTEGPSHPAASNLTRLPERQLQPQLVPSAARARTWAFPPIAAGHDRHHPGRAASSATLDGDGDDDIIVCRRHHRPRSPAKRRQWATSHRPCSLPISLLLRRRSSRRCATNYMEVSGDGRPRSRSPPPPTKLPGAA